MHYLLDSAFVEGKDGKELSYIFRKNIMNRLSYDTNPIFILLHEAIYCQNFAFRWSAHRVREKYPEFSDEAEDVLFTGEMVYPWFFDEYTELKPLKEAANILAEYDGWEPLYDVEKMKQNTVPVAAAVYYNDMFVWRGFSEETIETVPNIKYWMTNQYEHCGLRVGGEGLLQQLFDLLDGEIKFEC